MDPNASTNDILAWVIVDPDQHPDPLAVSPANKRFRVGTGVIKCRIRWQQYGLVGQHWKEQLSGRNLRKWGKIYIDANKAEQALNRSEALGPHRESSALRNAQQRLEAAATNLDECPGAMFVWETRETADVEPLCATTNQKFGRDLYQALRGAVTRAMVNPASFQRRDMQWFQVVFEFA